MIAIVAAMQQELSAIEEMTRAGAEVRSEVVAGCTLHHGVLGGVPVVLAQSGIGKAAAAATAAVLAQRANAVLMVGTAGGLGDGVNPGDIVVASELLQHDLDARPMWDRWVSPSIGLARVPTDDALTGALLGAAYDLCALPRAGVGRARVHHGLIVSGDGFATSELSLKLRRQLPDALAVEMEGAALAQVCYQAGVPFAVARTISDRADDEATVDFGAFLNKVAGPYARDLIHGALTRLAKN